MFEAESNVARRRIQQLIAAHPPRPVATSAIGVAFQNEAVRVEENRVRFSQTGAEGRSTRIARAGSSRHATIVIPVLADGRLVLVTRYRYAPGKWTVEFPRAIGKSDDSGWRETAEDCLASSGLAGVGLAPPEMRLLGGVHVDPELMATSNIVVVARNCAFAQPCVADAAEMVAGCFDVSPDCLDTLIVRGDVDCGLTLSALCLYRAALA